MNTPVEALSHWKFRENTWDGDIFKTVVEQNEYRLPERFDEKDIVIDGGAHIGSFSYACLSRGAGQVLAYEADYENYRLACQNLWKVGGRRVMVYRMALWRSQGRLYYQSCREPQNTGGGDVLFADEGQSVPARTLDEAIDDALWHGEGERIRLLKLDIEGSEWPVLLTSNRLDVVDEIVGEFHEIGGQYDGYHMPQRAQVGAHRCYVLPVLKSLLESQSFHFSHKRHLNSDGSPSSLGLFSAKR